MAIFPVLLIDLLAGLSFSAIEIAEATASHAIATATQIAEPAALRSHLTGNSLGVRNKL